MIHDDIYSIITKYIDLKTYPQYTSTCKLLSQYGREFNTILHEEDYHKILLKTAHKNNIKTIILFLKNFAVDDDLVLKMCLIELELTEQILDNFDVVVVIDESIYPHPLFKLETDIIQEILNRAKIPDMFSLIRADEVFEGMNDDINSYDDIFYEAFIKNKSINLTAPLGVKFGVTLYCLKCYISACYIFEQYFNGTIKHNKPLLKELTNTMKNYCINNQDILRFMILLTHMFTKKLPAIFDSLEVILRPFVALNHSQETYADSLCNMIDYLCETTGYYDESKLTISPEFHKTIAKELENGAYYTLKRSGWAS
jgi:hypothetical protein